MLLTKSSIIEAQKAGWLQITPWRPEQLNPNSYDLRLGRHVLRYLDDVLDAEKELNFKRDSIPSTGILIKPGELYLMATEEVTATDYYVPGIEGRSSVGRLGVSVHATAGFGDVGFNGTWTLEVSCIKPVRLYAGMRICQIFFEECSKLSSISHPDCAESGRYDGKYNGQMLPRESQIYTEAEEWFTPTTKAAEDAARNSM